MFTVINFNVEHKLSIARILRRWGKWEYLFNAIEKMKIKYNIGYTTYSILTAAYRGISVFRNITQRNV
jgi:hypothetical protein